MRYSSVPAPIILHPDYDIPNTQETTTPATLHLIKRKLIIALLSALFLTSAPHLVPPLSDCQHSRVPQAHVTIFPFRTSAAKTVSQQKFPSHLESIKATNY